MADVHQPTDLAEAVSVLAEHGGDAVPVAGGTDVLLDRRLGRIDPGHLVDLSGLPDLARVDHDDGTLRIGALTRLAALVADPDLRARLPAVAEGAAGVGTPLVRNMATLGGNLCQGAPHGEILPALLVHDAVLTVVGPDGERELAAADLLLGPRRSSLARGELLTSVAVPAAGRVRGAAYVPFDPAGVGVAVGLRLAEGRIQDARVALCWTVPFPQRVPAAEVVLEGADAPDAEVLGALETAVGDACDPLHEPVAGPLEHRRHVAGVIAGRAARIAWRRASGAWPTGDLAPASGRLGEGTA